MTLSQQRSLKLFRFSGINVYLHWSWAIIAIYEIQNRKAQYSSLFWNISEYLSLFIIVLLHEFGHALACKQVGGKADRIMLWPLGGIAYVSPPQRPGATLWSIAAGPLVNVVLGIFLYAALFSLQISEFPLATPNAFRLLISVTYINTAIFIFNMLPIYPLDGGQILRSLLWFPLGQYRSLVISVWLGMLGCLGLLGLSYYLQDEWISIIAVFVFLQCLRAKKIAAALKIRSQVARNPAFKCPSCKEPPPIGERWRCSKCQTAFDTFASGAVCPNCSESFATTACVFCGLSFPISDWKK